jgi:hypothetical protein
MTTTSIFVRRDDLRQTRIVEDKAASAPLSKGNVRLRVDAFALTANNITYAVFGNAMRYWDFFPTETEGEGCIPVWGFADVVESGVNGVAVGERFYGYYPMSTHVVVEPSKVTGRDFQDASAHRQELPGVYNRYARCNTDPLYHPEQEEQIAVLRPLFSTAFLLDDFLAGSHFFGAEVVLLSSASSKTAYATAFCLAQRRGTQAAAKIVGLTSPANLAFTRGLGCYDDVIPYDAIGSLPQAPTVYVDMSGSELVRRKVHEHFADNLKYSSAVGATDWDAPRGGEALPGPSPTLFFAPSQMKKRAEEWGAAALAERVAGTWKAFMKPVTTPPAPWLKIVRGRGSEAVLRTYRALLDGTVPAVEGHVLSL